ncbi:MAG: TOBE domain-containing protein [Polyangiaceae bacterium]|nr:TOBE domain-containing protein [Polyangiaceae bacterium]
MSPGRPKGEQPQRNRYLPSFSVPTGVKHLEPEQLVTLTQSFREWYQQQLPRPADRRARGRIWLIFLIIRYTAAKLGEAVAIDEQKDLDLVRGVLTLPGTRKGQARREIRLPPDVVEEISAYLEAPASEALRGRVFGLDQGFVRRKFYERADACSIPRDLASPQVIRASRALELLDAGMPLPVVQRLLGQQTANLTASYVDYDPDDIGRIFEAYLLAELRTRTSARNLFVGHVAGIHPGEILSEVTLQTSEGYRVTSVITNPSLQNLGLEKGAAVTGMIKAPLVTISTGEDPPTTSARNVFGGRVTAIRSDGVMAEVVAELRGGVEVCALITAGSLKRMQLEVEDDAWVVFDTSAVILSLAWNGATAQEVNL